MDERDKKARREMREEKWRDIMAQELAKESGEETKGGDAELVAHLMKTPDEEFVRGAKQDAKGDALDVSLNLLYKAKSVKIGGVDVAEWYTKEVDASGKGIRPWDRMPDEPLEAYQAFVMWLFSGVDKDKPRRQGAGSSQPIVPTRMYKKAWQNFLTITGQDTITGKENVIGCPQVWRDWAKEYDWEARAVSYDRQYLEEFGEKMALARRDIEDRVGTALLKALEKCVSKVENADLESLSVSAAIYALVQISQELRNFVAFTERGKPSASTVLDALPEGLRQAVLVAINVDQIVVQQQKETNAAVIDTK